MKQIYLKCALIVFVLSTLFLALLLTRQVMSVKPYALAAERANDRASQLKKDLEQVTATAELLSNRFHLVTKEELPEDGSYDIPGLEQTLRREDERVVKRYLPAEKTLEAVQESYRNYLKSEGKMDLRYTMPNRNYLVSRNAAVLQQIAREAGFQARFGFVWDMKMKQTWVTGVLNDPMNPDEVFHISMTTGDEDVARAHSKYDRDSNYVVQNLPSAVVFPFQFDLLGKRDYADLYPAGEFPIPVGQLYLHFYKIYASDWFTISYKFPKGVEPSDCNLQMISLDPGVRVIDTMKGDTVSFFVEANRQKGGDVLLVVAGDKAFVPSQVSLRITNQAQNQ